MKLNASILTLTVLVSGNIQADETSTVSFQKDIIPLLKRRCASCHITGQEPGNMALIPKRAYASLVDAPSIGSSLKRVNPGDPDNSYLLHKLQGTQSKIGGSGEQMPFMAPPLNKKQIALIRSWVANGAPNN